jgi:four helix bundle protein
MIERLEKLVTAEELKARTKAFALRVIKLVDAMPHSLAAQVIGKQLLRAATSLGANYRAACRAQSRAEFAAKLSIVVEEADEALYWLELVQETGLVKAALLTGIIKEANELVAVILASRKTAKTHDRSANRKSTIENQQLGGSRSSPS